MRARHGQKNTRNTRASIVDAAWQLFYEQGYEDTTVEEIIAASHTSKGSFYHYFGGRTPCWPPSATSLTRSTKTCSPPWTRPCLRWTSSSSSTGPCLKMIEDRVPLDLLARLLSTQLVTTGTRHLLDHRRTYYRLLRQIIAQGQETGQLTRDQSVSDMVKIYALCERALLYDWCLCGGEYSLAAYAREQMPRFLAQLLPGNSSG